MNAALPNLLLFAKLSSFAYLVNEDELRRRVEAEGLSFICLLKSGDAHAFLCQQPGVPKTMLIFRGTPVVEHTSVKEIICDVDTDPTDLGILGNTPSGPFEGTAAICAQVIHLGYTPDYAGGHSLGGWRAEQSKLFFPHIEVYSYGAPMAGDLAFWQKVYGNQPPNRVVHEHDFAPEWPEVNLHHWCQYPGSFFWLHNDLLVDAMTRPGLDVSVSDHDVDTGYVESLQKLQVPNGQ